MSKNLINVTINDLRDYAFAEMVCQLVDKNMYDDAIKQSNATIVNTNLGVEQLQFDKPEKFSPKAYKEKHFDELKKRVLSDHPELAKKDEKSVVALNKAIDELAAGLAYNETRDYLYTHYTKDEDMRQLIVNAINRIYNHIQVMGFPRVDDEGKPLYPTDEDGKVIGSEPIQDFYGVLTKQEGVTSDPVQHIVDVAESFKDNHIANTSVKIKDIPVAILVQDESKTDDVYWLPRTISIDTEKLQKNVERHED